MSWTLEERKGALAETCLSLADLCSSLPDDTWSLPTGCPGWSVFDQVAHVSSLESMFAGVEPIPYDAGAPDHVRNSIGQAMENLLGARRGWEPAALVAELREVTELRQRQLADVGPDDTLPGPTGKPLPVVMGLSLRTFDVLAHELDVRRAVDRPGGLDGVAGPLVRDHIGFLLGRTWKEPVRLLVDGVEVPVGSGDPAVTMTVALADLIPLTCGRSDVSTDTVSLSGDVDLGRSLLATIALTP